jgi:hypothetical protein
MSHSPIRSLIASLLGPKKESSGFLDTEFQLQLFDAATPIGAEALAGAGVGLDLHNGERVLAAVLSRETPKGHEHRLAAAITDRRTVLSGWSSTKGGHNNTRGNVLHSDIQRIDTKDSMLSSHVTLIGSQGKVELTFPPVTAMLATFYRSMVDQIPPHARIEPNTPLLWPSHQDRVGLSAAGVALWVNDSDAQRMLGTIASSFASGQVNQQVAADFAARVVLAHRARASGPGMVNGQWVSPMCAQDLGMTLARVFGTPTAHTQPQPGWESLDFAVDPSRDPIGTAVSALGVASWAALGVGFAPGKMLAGALLKKQPITQVRVVFGDTGSFCSYLLYYPGGNLEVGDAMMAHQLHQLLIHMSYDVLHRRVQYGWNMPYHELVSTDLCT